MTPTDERPQRRRSLTADGARRFAGNAAKGAAFPILLMVLVAGFVAVQNQIDRRDPKLAQTPIWPDARIEFE